MDLSPSLSKSSLESCSIGKETGHECHKTSYTPLKKLNDIEALSKAEKELLSLRSGVQSDFLVNICEHHFVYYMKKYETYQIKCCDPYNKHKNIVTKSLRHVNEDFSREIFNKLNLKIPPGQKLCTTCRKYLQTLPHTIEQDTALEQSDSEQSMSNLEASFNKEQALNTMNSSFNEIGISPLKLHAVASHSRKNYTKRKTKLACDILTAKASKVVGKDISDEKDNQNVSKDIKQKAKDFDNLLDLIKEKLKITQNRKEKIQLLTLIPLSWSRQKVMKEFEVSDYAVKQSRLLLKESGILALPEPKKGKVLSLQTVELVHNFYENDENTRIMPGKKDVVSIAKNVHKQKRLILTNLRELYASFKLEFPEAHVKFSKFCMLRPKWCVLAGSSGTHAVCVCTIHQNVILLLHAASQIKESYHDLIAYIVCSKEKRDCMLRHCSNCPPSETLRRILEEKFENYDPCEEIEYSQWVSTDRTELIKCTVTVDEYLDKAIEKLEKLIPHSFIAHAQSNYLNETKSNLKLDMAVVLLDFSENFSYIIQDEAQGYHWTRSACTVHPVIIYVRLPDSMGLTILNICILSDDLIHDVAFVYATQKEVTNLIHQNFPLVQKVSYFSDGCAGQYKNCKNFKNLCLHAQDFSLEASWSFFATSHGKSPCDGIGGTVKRLITKESLQRCFNNQIVSIDEVFNYCTSRIEEII